MKKFLFLLIGLLLVFNCTKNSPTTGTSDNDNFIKGKIIDNNGNGISAKVYLISNSVIIDTSYTDDSGVYLFNLSSTGKYTIKIVYKGINIIKEINLDTTDGYNVEDIIIDNIADTTYVINDSAQNSDTTTLIPKDSTINSSSSSSSIIADTTNISPIDTTTSSDTTIINQPITLVPVAENKQMTIQFINSTNKYPDSLLYISVIGKDSADDWSYLKPDGSTIKISSNETGEDWFFSLKNINGLQVPKKFTSARLYISVNEKLNMSSVLDVNGNIGIVQPNLANPNDPNYTKIFEWAEFTVANGSFWGNTTQVDQFSFPFTLSLYKDGDELVNRVGIEKSREDIFTQFQADAPAEFQNLLKYPYRIVAPAKGNFGTNDENGDYFADYVNEIWTQYKTDTLTVHHPLGDFKGVVLSDDRFEFTRLSDNEKFYISGKPNNSEILEGSGVLATGNTEELALEAWVCAAFNRHVMQYNNTDEWNNANNYYKEYPMNYYSKFFHDISIDNKSYGFCYDDVNDQSTLVYTQDVRAIVINILW